MQITHKLGLGGFLAIAALVGCGGNSSGGGFTTSVPSGTKLTSLTPQQAMQLCTDFDAFGTTALTPDVCKLLAIEATALSLSFSSTGQPSDATLQMTCTQSYNNCLSGGDGGVTSTSSCDPSTFTTEPSTCTATVGDLTTCTNADLATAKQEVAGLPSCSSVTSSNLISALAHARRPGRRRHLDVCDLHRAGIELQRGLVFVVDRRPGDGDEAPQEVTPPSPSPAGRRGWREPWADGGPWFTPMRGDGRAARARLRLFGTPERPVRC